MLEVVLGVTTPCKPEETAEKLLEEAPPAVPAKPVESRRCDSCGLTGHAGRLHGQTQNSTQVTSTFLPLNVWLAQGWEESQVTNSEQEWDEEKQCYTYRVDVKKLKWKEALQQSAELLQLESEAAAKGPRNPDGLPPPRGGAGGAEKDEEQELEAHNARCLAHAQKALPGVTQQLCNLLAAAQTLDQAPEDAFDSGLCGTLRGLLQRHQGFNPQLETLRKAPLWQEQELEEGPDAALLSRLARRPCVTSGSR